MGGHHLVLENPQLVDLFGKHLRKNELPWRRPAIEDSVPDNSKRNHVHHGLSKKEGILPINQSTNQSIFISISIHLYLFIYIYVSISIHLHLFIKTYLSTSIYIYIYSCLGCTPILGHTCMCNRKHVLFICGIFQAKVKCLAEMLAAMLIGYLFGLAIPVASGYTTIVVRIISQILESQLHPKKSHPGTTWSRNSSSSKKTMPQWLSSSQAGLLQMSSCFVDDYRH